MQVEELFIYPLKSARAQKIPQMQITAEGPDGDRQWMLVDETGRFISQRTLPKLATVEVFHDKDSLTVAFQKMFFKISKNNSFLRKITVSVWNDTFEAALEPDLYSQGLSQYLGQPVRLVRYAPFSKRNVTSTQESWSPEVRFSDGRPLLLTNNKSLEDLNAKLEVPVGMNRFRPNVVVSGHTPFEEDSWKKIKIGSAIFSQPRKSSRCVMVNIDQQTGVPQGVEPLKTLASYRREDGKVIFGSLWIPENEGVIRAGDRVEILDH